MAVGVLFPLRVEAIPHVQIYVENGAEIPYQTVVAAAMIGLDEQLKPKFSYGTEEVEPACEAEGSYSSINFISQDKYRNCWIAQHPVTRKTKHWARIFLAHPYELPQGYQAFGGQASRIGGPGHAVVAGFDSGIEKTFWHVVKVTQHELLHLWGARHNCDVMSAVMCSGMWVTNPAFIDPRNLIAVERKLRNKKIWNPRFAK
jgi:hypothetical protein